MNLASEYMAEDTFERWINYATEEETDKFCRQLVNNRAKWSREIIEKVEQNAQKAEKAITDAQDMYASFVWEDGSFIATGEERPDYLKKLIKCHEDMLNLTI